MLNKDQTSPKPAGNQGSIFIRPTGIEALDQILKGGLPTNAAVLLAGNSGSGKTILALQWLFSGFQKFDESGLYITLTEPTGKVLKNVKKMDFCDSESIQLADIRFSSVEKEKTYAKGVHFMDLRQIMAEMKMENRELTRKDSTTICEFLLEKIITLNVSRVVLDSVTAIAYRFHDANLIRDFIFQLGTYLGHADINLIMTSEAKEGTVSVFGIEEFISDGIIKLSYQREKHQLARNLEIVKMRGVAYDSHPAYYRISSAGITLYPRLHREMVFKVSEKRLSTGINGFDEMNNGGYLENSSIIITGASGSGKTLIGLQFLNAGFANKQKALLFSFEESREQIIKNASAFGWDFAQAEKKGLLKIITLCPESKYLDEHLNYIQKTISEFQPKRFVLDSLSSIKNAFSEEALYDFATRLFPYLKQSNITALTTAATSGLMSADKISDAYLSTLTDHIIMLRYVEIQSEIHHALMILKMRGSNHDRKLRELIFTDSGLAISSEFKGYEGVLAGSTRKISNSIEEQIRALFLETFGPMGEKIFQEEKNKGLTNDNLQKLINQLGDQGIISKRRKENFIAQSETIFGLGGQETTKQ